MLQETLKMKPNEISGINDSYQNSSSDDQSVNGIELIPVEYNVKSVQESVKVESEVKGQESEAKSSEFRSIERTLNFGN
jgi:hypothetical protein